MQTPTKLVVVSDVHLGAALNSTEKFIKFLHSLSKDTHLILNGDIYDLYISKPTINIFKEIPVAYTYILGNHDEDIQKFYPFLKTQMKKEIGDIVIIHGHSFDSLNSIRLLDKTLTIINNWIAKIFYFDLKQFFREKFFKGTVAKAQDKASKLFYDKILVMGHTHIPSTKYPVFNCGAMTEGVSTYLEINFKEHDVVEFELKEW